MIRKPLDESRATSKLQSWNGWSLWCSARRRGTDDELTTIRLQLFTRLPASCSAGPVFYAHTGMVQNLEQPRDISVTAQEEKLSTFTRLLVTRLGGDQVRN